MPPKKKTAQELASLPKRRSGPAPKYDYDAARLEYIEGIAQDDGSSRLPSLKELAERHDIPYTAIRRAASKERWTERQTAYQSQIAQERQRKRIKELASQGIEFDTNAHRAAQLGVSMTTARLAEIAEEFKVRAPRIKEARERVQNGEPVEKWELYSAVNYRELEGLASALDRFQSVGMKALGTDVSRHEISNPDGSLQPQTININAELARDDPERLGAFIAALHEVGLTPNDIAQEGVVDAEVVEDEVDDDEQDGDEE